MHAVTNTDPVPSYLRGTYDMLVTAFPNGVPDEDYRPLLGLLGEQMSMRSLAHVVALITGNAQTRVYHDLLGILSPATSDKPATAAIEKVKQLLLPHGYERWQAAE